MKTQVVAITILSAINCFAGNIPDGIFNGRGLWKSAKQTGSYQVSTTIKDGKVKTAYVLSDGSTKNLQFTMQQSGNGFFKVRSAGSVVGTGYCLEKADVCHYEIKSDKLNLEETLTLMDGKLYKFGSKDEGHGQIVWQESLTDSTSAASHEDDQTTKVQHLENLATTRSEKLFRDL